MNRNDFQELVLRTQTILKDSRLCQSTRQGVPGRDNNPEFLLAAHEWEGKTNCTIVQVTGCEQKVEPSPSGFRQSIKVLPAERSDPLPSQRVDQSYCHSASQIEEITDHITKWTGLFLDLLNLHPESRAEENL